MTLRLLSLLQSTPHIECIGYKNILIGGLSENSSQIKKNDLFFVKKGAHFDGKDYTTQAIQKGSSAIISENNDIVCNVPLIHVENINKSETSIAKLFYEDIDESIYIIGITGTNGKTTISYMLESICLECGYKVGVIGTINYRIRDKKSTVILQSHYKNTTPSLLEVMRLLSIMKKHHVKIVIMEISSHALSQNRIHGLNFDQAIFTNLTPEHLDFHENMESYFLAKSKLLYMIGKNKNIKNVTASKAIWTNIEDTYGTRIYHTRFPYTPVYSYAVQNKSAHLCVTNLKQEIKNISFSTQFKNQNIDITSHLTGQYNISNMLSAIGCSLLMNIPIPMIQTGIKNLFHIPGRLEYIDLQQDFFVCVDFAHTPDAFYQVFKNIKCLSSKRLITVFGCGGDRDRKKRSAMGEIAMFYSDHVIVTNDNPRSENPSSITDNIEVGIKKIKNHHYDIILDRQEAIKYAIKLAHSGDFIIILGKGHEDYQIENGQIEKFSDIDVTKRQLISMISKNSQRVYNKII